MMCHSVEMYLPGLTRDVAEGALWVDRAPRRRAAGLAAAVAERCWRLARRPRGLSLGPLAARGPALAALLLLAACAQPAPEPPAETYDRVPQAIENNDTNVYHFEHAGPNSLGTLAVTARPTAGPNAAPAGTMAGEAGRTMAESAVASYAASELCEGAAFRLASEATSQYDARTNAWTVFGRCASA